MANLGEKLERLKRTEDIFERNSLAIELTETAHPIVKSILIDLIDRPDLSDQRGTLVNCLGRFDCSDKLLWLINLVCQGNWEVAHEAFELLANIESVDSSKAKLGFDMLSKNINSSQVDHWRKNLMDDLLRMFD